MKKQFRVLLAGAAIVGMTMSLSGAALSSAALNENSNKQKPVPATDFEIVKKVAIPMTEKNRDFVSKKGKPEKPGKSGAKKGAATGVLGETLSSGASKYAIVIGISDYPGKKWDIGAPNYLNYEDIDATNMKDALVNLYGYSENNIYFFKDETALYDDIFSAVGVIKDLEKEGDEVVFYFSGHGGQIYDELGGDETDGIDELIVCHDGQKAVGILDDILKEWFEDFDTSRIIFIFDSCFAGGMNDVADKEGRVVAMATGERTVAYAWLYHEDQTTQGQFSYYFVEDGMLGGSADKYDHNNDGTVGEGNDVVVEEAFDYAKKKCLWQIPAIKDLFENDLLPGYSSAL